MEHVLVVHGEDGLDEITISGKTYISELKNGEIMNYEISPKDFSLKNRHLAEITANSPSESLELVKGAFLGKSSAVQDMIALNAAASLYLSRQSNSISEGIEQAFAIMNDGSAMNKLNAYVRESNL